jgi:hypothetical protein
MKKKIIPWIQKFEFTKEGQARCEVGLLGAVTDLVPEDLMSGAAEIQGVLWWYQAEGRCW